jgi:serine/threonine protein phosphatase PrpC
MGVDQAQGKSDVAFVRVYGATEVGVARAQNQDAIVVCGTVGVASGARLSWEGKLPDAGIVISVVDGMGGYAGGADAAGVVALMLAGVSVASVSGAWDTWLEQVAGRLSAAGKAWETPDMGATVAILCVKPDGIEVANIGDCRAYRISDGFLGQLTVDDKGDPTSAAVTQSLGGPATTLDPHTWLQARTAQVERFMLCSDGVYGALDQELLRGICASGQPIQSVVEAVSEMVYARGADDNCSIIMVEITGGF